MKRSLLALLLTFFATSVVAQNPYLSLEGVIEQPDGSVALLQPATSLVIDVEARCERTLCGPYARYAQKFLGERAPLTDRVEWRVLSAHVSLATDDVLYASAPAADSYSERQYARSDEEFALLPVDKRTFLTPTLEEAARAAAEQIFSLRKHRTELITGEAGENVFGEGLRAALEEIDRQEQAYLELFYGKQSTRQVSRRYYVTPTNEKLNYVVCRFSPEQGLLPALDLSGEMVVLQITPEEEVDTVIPEAGLKATETAVCVVANRAACVVSLKGEELARRELPLFQYGRKITIALPRRK